MLTTKKHKQINDRYKIFLISFMGIMLVSCAKQSPSHPERTIFHITENQKRLNTIDCDDIDDWYLEGYRVGKSFKNHKKKIFSQRLNFCQLSAENQITEQLKQSWEQGYQKGIR